MKRSHVLLLASASALLLALGVWGCAQKSAGPRTVAISVTDRGFEPAEVKLRAGEPVTLVVKRTTDATCAKEFVIAAVGIHQELPLNQEVRIEYTPDRPGDVKYACGMDMVSGTLKVE